MSFKTLYFSTRNAPECRKMHLNSQIFRGSMPPNPTSVFPRFAQSILRFAWSLWATKDDFGPLKKNNLVAQIKFLGHWPKTLSVQHCVLYVLRKFFMHGSFSLCMNYVFTHCTFITVLAEERQS